VDDTVRFATKPALGLRLLERALDGGLPARWVTADEAYGNDSKFRIWLQQRQVSYVLAVACTQKIPTESGSSRADVLAAAAPALAWKRRSCGPGAKGQRLYDWAVATLPDTGTACHGYTRWLLIRRSISKPTELAYYLCYGPVDTRDEQLIRVAGTLGDRGMLPDSQGPGRPGRVPGPPLRRLVPARHPGHARPRLPRRDGRGGKRPSPPDRLIALTLAEVRRLLAHLIATIRPREFINRWSVWRRHHQHRAKTSHYQRRHHTSEVLLEY
jgi:hypothetical protein